MTDHPPCFGIVGWKNTGKTTMTARLTRELSRRGLTISTIKRAQSGFEIDQPGTDSHTHRQAGAYEVAIVAPERWALMHENHPGEPEPPLDDIVARLSHCDLVLVEGFKEAHHPKLEMRLAAEVHTPALHESDPTVIALAYDSVPSDSHRLPAFQRDSIGTIADRVVVSCGLEAYRRPAR
ncbi:MULTISPECIES: molybdopterin-guanine dinucleotide biosynthesis protein B [unclassified Roseitalea]|uniref:molybdopterin-guanine dinucleotide biosynthesis protein B n=1 Tax=unclassified Roseitalea TaxID=2639107 RepID=UPI00273E4B9C|nr:MULTISPECIES: molybdopterin-guanine dinucleotide biosynthesis protein B [unclassified Roseitalea]